MFFLGETFVDGQNQDVWCRSKIPITDMKMHYGGSQLKQGDEKFTKSSSCYLAYNTGSAQNVYGLILFGDACLLESMNYMPFYFTCE
jgi:hypothetical protein